MPIAAALQRSLSFQGHDDWVDISTQRLSTRTLGALYPGSRFKGTQQCAATEYEVIVDIQHIDIKESTMSGYLNIKGLTTEFPELTTFFKAEIIGPTYPFLTRKWQAYQSIDLEHWKRFPSFEPYVHLFHHDNFTYDPTEQDYIYMRWKEHFLVPDHHVRNIDGASFEGFYYICYRRSTDEISGYYYYYNHDDWYQELKLRHVDQRSFGHFEFR
ncbi:vacuolar import and degradation protein-domain-containing protein [Dichotomocladium elegans]|nr:vacuolar import and degradation protein-domain-containing protein [Dichotomocladium elegans]